MVLPFLRVQKKSYEALWLYRSCIKVIQQLQPNHQKIWYDYVRLKYEESANVTDKEKIKKLIRGGFEELDWVQSVLTRKKGVC